MARPGLRRDPVAAHNERVKLMATSLNAIGLGLIGFAILRPLTENPAGLGLTSLWWAAAGLVVHGVSHYVLERPMQKDDRDDPV